VDLYRSEPLDDREDILKWAKRYDETSSKRMSEYWFDRGFTHRTMLEFEVRYDEKYNCLIWPIRDEHSNLLGFARRYVPPSDNFKRYEYPRRFKRTLFPLDHLKGDRIILVEGPLDALWLHQHGYSESLAVLGSGLTQAQLGWLKGNARSVILLFDNDRDGRAGGERTAKQLSEIYTMFATLPNDVKDVQELEGERLAEMLENARPTFVR
jgi:DNA primase